MTTAKDQSRKLRQQATRAVQEHADAIRETVTQEVIAGLYMMPLGERIKWGLKIIRGLDLPWYTRLWLWTSERVRHAYRWAKLFTHRENVDKQNTVPFEVVAEEPTGAIDTDTELVWLKKDKKDAQADKK